MIIRPYDELGNKILRIVSKTCKIKVKFTCIIIMIVFKKIK